MTMVRVSKSAIHKGNLILVNQSNPYREMFAEPSLVPVGEDARQIKMERGAVSLLSSLMTDISGWPWIVPVSGWRSKGEQAEIFNKSLEENGEEFTHTYIAMPGCSEHQTGLAIDLGWKQNNIDFIRPEFPYFGICQIFRNKAVQYGFVERYPKGKENITGIGHEPWHFRYVGMPHSAIMAKLDLTLEEYVTFLKQYPNDGEGYVYQKDGHQITISYIAGVGGLDISFQVDSGLVYSYSGNNVDGLIITSWRVKKNS